MYIINNEKNKITKTYLAREDEVIALGHPIRLKILNALAKRSLNNKELAITLNLSEQLVSYHLKYLIKANLVRVKKYEHIRGTISKLYALNKRAITIMFNPEWDNYFGLSFDKKIISFFDEFRDKNNVFNGKIVVGSPDPHGPYKARARDGHYAADLAMFLGNYFKLPKRFCVSLDVDNNINNKENFILIGGPITNLLVGKINKYMRTRFNEKKPFSIETKRGQDYFGDNVGLICKFKNPFNNKWVIVLAGIRYNGTKASVIALTRFYNKLLSLYTPHKEFFSVVEGFDLDGDGKIDSIEILES